LASKSTDKAMEVITIESQAYQELLKQLQEIKDQLSKKETASAPNPWLDNKQVCKLFNLTTRQLQNYRDNGLLPFSQPKGKVYYKTSDIEAFFQKHYITAFSP
jgi:hypothetical protein